MRIVGIECNSKLEVFAVRSHDMHSLQVTTEECTANLWGHNVNFELHVLSSAALRLHYGFWTTVLRLHISF